MEIPPNPRQQSGQVQLHRFLTPLEKGGKYLEILFEIGQKGGKYLKVFFRTGQRKTVYYLKIRSFVLAKAVVQNSLVVDGHERLTVTAV